MDWSHIFAYLGKRKLEQNQWLWDGTKCKICFTHQWFILKKSYNFIGKKSETGGREEWESREDSLRKKYDQVTRAQLLPKYATEKGHKNPNCPNRQPICSFKPTMCIVCCHSGRMQNCPVGGWAMPTPPNIFSVDWQMYIFFRHQRAPPVLVMDHRWLLVSACLEKSASPKASGMAQIVLHFLFPIHTTFFLANVMFSDMVIVCDTAWIWQWYNNLTW